MEIKIIKTYKDAEQIWLGLEQEGHRRKVFRAVDEKQLGAKHLVVQACHPEHNPDTAGLPPVDLASLRSLAKDFPGLAVRE